MVYWDLFLFFSWVNESDNKRCLTGLLLRSREMSMKSSLVDTCNMKFFPILFLLVGLHNSPCIIQMINVEGQKIKSSEGGRTRREKWKVCSSRCVVSICCVEKSR